MTYNTRIKREQGGSVLTVASGGSLNVNDGGFLGLSGNQVFSGGSVQIGDTASLILRPGATTEDAMYPMLNMGKNTFWYSPGSAGSPITSASTGDILWISNSASTSLWVNVSDGTTGSNWDYVRLNAAGSQIVSGP